MHAFWQLHLQHCFLLVLYGYSVGVGLVGLDCISGGVGGGGLRLSVVYDTTSVDGVKRTSLVCGGALMLGPPLVGGALMTRGGGASGENGNGGGAGRATGVA